MEEGCRRVLGDRVSHERCNPWSEMAWLLRRSATFPVALWVLEDDSISHITTKAIHLYHPPSGVFQDPKQQRLLSMRSLPGQPSGLSAHTLVLTAATEHFLIVTEPVWKGKHLCVCMRVHTQFYRNHFVKCNRPPNATALNQRRKQQNYYDQHKFRLGPQGSGYHGNSNYIQGCFT